MDALSWFKGLAASMISAVATSVLASGISSSTGAPLNWQQIGSIAASSALVGACLYLKQSPIPDSSTTIKSVSFEPQKTTVTETKTVPAIDPINK